MSANEMEEAEEDLEYLLTYSDMITLLLAFFAILIASSTPDQALWDQMKEGMRSEVTGTEIQKTPLAEIKADLDSILTTEREQGLVNIDLTNKEIVMTFNSSSLYISGGAELLPSGEGIIRKVGDALNGLSFYNFKVDIEGHTDNVPINTLRFPSNWELSVARASEVVKFLVNLGYEPSNLKASGYADTQPLPNAPHTDEFGQDIIENRAKNRRIVLRIFY
ncbi:flagellar motor protein MotB [Bacteroidota bacterium]|jgi:chemotaxis protein MotB|nr:flagellar motor protein MotB [Balneolaceae bacterium]MDC3136092.1 flagellar motor protein MotB [Bacteroidota bacterium]